MKPQRDIPLWIAAGLLLLIAILLFGGIALAGSGYQLTASVVAGGGGTLKNGSYSLSGTVGQADASGPLQNGAYVLTGGFWHGGVLKKNIFLPLVVRH